MKQGHRKYINNERYDDIQTNPIYAYTQNTQHTHTFISRSNHYISVRTEKRKIIKKNNHRHIYTYTYIFKDLMKRKIILINFTNLI